MGRCDPIIDLFKNDESASFGFIYFSHPNTENDLHSTLKTNSVTIEKDTGTEILSLAPPSPYLLSVVDESWPEDLLFTTLKATTSVSKSVMSMGKLVELEELTPRPSLEYNHRTIYEQSTEIENPPIIDILHKDNSERIDIEIDEVMDDLEEEIEKGVSTKDITNNAEQQKTKTDDGDEKKGVVQNTENNNVDESLNLFKTSMKDSYKKPTTMTGQDLSNIKTNQDTNGGRLEIKNKPVVVKNTNNKNEDNNLKPSKTSIKASYKKTSTMTGQDLSNIKIYQNINGGRLEIKNKTAVKNANNNNEDKNLKPSKTSIKHSYKKSSTMTGEHLSNIKSNRDIINGGRLELKNRKAPVESTVANRSDENVKLSKTSIKDPFKKPSAMTVQHLPNISIIIGESISKDGAKSRLDKSLQTVITSKRKQFSPKQDLIPDEKVYREWCKGLINVAENLERWSSWINNVDEQIKCLHNKGLNKHEKWLKLRNDVKYDAQLWLNLSRHLHTGLMSYRNNYPKVTSYKCICNKKTIESSRNYRFCMSKSNM